MLNTTPSAAAIAALSRTTPGGSSRSLLKIGRSRSSYRGIAAPGGSSSRTAASSARVSEALRMLPQIPRSATIPATLAPKPAKSVAPDGGYLSRRAAYGTHGYVLQLEEAPHAAARRGAARPADGDAGGGHALREWPPDRAAVPRRDAARDVRHGLLLGRRAQVLADPRRVRDRGWLRRWPEIGRAHV